MSDTYFQILKEAEQILPPSIYFEDAQHLLLHVFNLKKSSFLANLNVPILDREKRDLFYDLVSVRKTGKPLAYILGYVDFRGRCYQVREPVLIPRPETEFLVNIAIDQIKKNWGEEACFVGLELGLGSGVITGECALEFSHASFYGWDISQQAVDLTKLNFDFYGLTSTHVFHGDFFESHFLWKPLLLQSNPLVFFSNPPYVAKEDLKHLDVGVKNYESMTALDGGDNGLLFYEKLFKLFKEVPMLHIYEFGIDQKPLLEKLLSKYGYQSFEFYEDYQLIPRVLVVNPKYNVS